MFEPLSTALAGQRVERLFGRDGTNNRPDRRPDEFLLRVRRDYNS